MTVSKCPPLSPKNGGQENSRSSGLFWVNSSTVPIVPAFRGKEKRKNGGHGDSWQNLAEVREECRPHHIGDRRGQSLTEDELTRRIHETLALAKKAKGTERSRAPAGKAGEFPAWDRSFFASGRPICFSCGGEALRDGRHLCRDCDAE